MQTSPQPDTLIAGAWMIGAALSFTAMAVGGREIQVEMNTFELMFYRSAIGLGLVCALIWRSSSGFATLRTRRPGLHLQRNVFHYAGQNLWFYALAAIPLGQVVSLEFTNPIWVALLAPLMLGERLTRPRLLAAVIGFAGVLVIARPGTSPVEIGHAAALGAAFMFAMNNIYTKKIMPFDSVLCVMFWMTLSQMLASLVISLPGGVPLPGPVTLPWIVVVGVAGVTAHYSPTSALAHAPASIVAPMEFLRLPFFAGAGMLLYGEPLGAAVLVGALLIITANLVNLRAENRRAGR